MYFGAIDKGGRVERDFEQKAKSRRNIFPRSNILEIEAVQE